MQDIVFDDVQASKNTAELIADALRKAISQGKIKGGEFLRQDEIAAAFKVSKIPVREALFQLQAEGFVEFIRNRGAVVATLSTAEIEEIYAMRMALETMALRRAVPNMSAADFVQAEGLLNEIDHVEDLQMWAELNWRFHEKLYRPSGMLRLLETVKTLHANVVRYLLSNQSENTEAFLATSQRQHREILELCRRGDVEAACHRLGQHLAGAGQALVPRSSSFSPYP